MAGQRQKPREQLANPRGGRSSKLQPVEERPQDAEVDLQPPPWISDEAVEVWNEAVWLMKDHILPSDMFRLRRYIQWVEVWLMQMREILDGDDIARGSETQPVEHPRWKILDRAERAIAQAETTMGLNPQARMRLGINIREGEKAWAELKASREQAKPAPRKRAK